MAIDRDFYNESSAAKLGWDPTWFGEKYFDDKLTRAIKKWQKEKGLICCLWPAPSMGFEVPIGKSPGYDFRLGIAKESLWCAAQPPLV